MCQTYKVSFSKDVQVTIELFARSLKDPFDFVAIVSFGDEELVIIFCKQLCFLCFQLSFKFILKRY